METSDTTELLAGLKGIHLPPPPAAPDLWPVALSIIVCGFALLFFIIRYYRQQNSWHHHALSTLSKLQQQAPADALHQTASLLKRATLTEKSNITTKHLNGQPWLQYLDNFFNTNYFTSGDGQVFGERLYKPGATLTTNNYRELKKLIKRHRWRQ